MFAVKELADAKDTYGDDDELPKGEEGHEDGMERAVVYRLVLVDIERNVDISAIGDRGEVDLLR